MTTETASQSWHAWKRPDIALTRVLAVGLYCVPSDCAPAPHWAEKLGTLLSECKLFHEKHFPGSVMEWSLRGPLQLSFSSSKFTGDADGFYTKMSAEARAKASALCELPPIAKCSPPGTSALRGAVAHPGAPDFLHPAWSTHIVFVCFADWGSEDAKAKDAAGRPQLAKYYIWPAAVAQSVNLDDITLTGGSRSSFLGLVKRSDLCGVWQCDAGSGESVGARWDIAAMGTNSRVGFGLGLVTQEAWLHPEVRSRQRQGCKRLVMGHVLASDVLLRYFVPGVAFPLRAVCQCVTPTHAWHCCNCRFTAPVL